MMQAFCKLFKEGFYCLFFTEPNRSKGKWDCSLTILVIKVDF